MILRTPPARKRRASNSDSSPFAAATEAAQAGLIPSSNNNLVIYEDPDTPLPHESTSHNPSTSDQLLCTYQCRQMVKSDFVIAYDNAEKQVREYQLKFEQLSEQFRNSGNFFCV
ncbi:hypothetical protein ACHQM5_001427 [Ranunculus cassubicifolius]